MLWHSAGAWAHLVSSFFLPCLWQRDCSVNVFVFVLIIFSSSLVSVWKPGKGKKRKAIEKGISALHARRMRRRGVGGGGGGGEFFNAKYCSSAHAMYVVGMF